MEVLRQAPSGKVRLIAQGRIGQSWSLPWEEGDFETLKDAHDHVSQELADCARCPQLRQTMKLYDDTGKLLNEREGGWVRRS